jgi:L-cysteine/cystine lyase
MPDTEKVPAVRAALPAVDAGIYLNTGSVGPLPAETAAAMAEMAGWELRTGRGHVDTFHDFLDRLDEARASVAAVLGTGVDAIALTHAATEGMNHAAWSVDWRPGDRVVTTRLEHAGGVGPLYALRERAGIDVAFVDIGDGGDDERTLAAFDAAITPGTRLVACSHVSYATGAVLPIAAIAELAHARGAVVAVDGAQAAGAIPVNVPDSGADFYAISGQKWLLGPEGTGALAVAPSALAAARPAFAGWFSFEQVDARGAAAFRADARRFEVGGFYRPAVVGLARSIGWLSMYVGLDWIHRRGTALARAAADRLASIPGVELVTPRERMATLVTFRIAGWPAEAALDELGARVFAIARTIPEIDALRISVGFFTTEEEIERFAEAVELLASHSPTSIPPRRTLTILGQDA